tara:strand:+ start:2718 stop:2960 length:243 start_codon:yes stop_codon:yes gene_type:complete
MVKVSKNVILLTPEVAIQQMSLQIFKEREKIISDLKGKIVGLKTLKGVENGTFLGADNTHFTIKMGETTKKSLLKNILIY